MPTEHQTDTEGPRGTYGCACVSRDAKDCTLLRYGFTFDRPLACECLCHQRDDDEYGEQGEQ